MERTRHSLLTGRNYWRLNRNSPAATYWKPLTTKASNRAAVHGVKPPVPDIINKEEVQKNIQKGKEEKEAKRKQIEKTINSHLSTKSDET